MTKLKTAEDCSAEIANLLSRQRPMVWPSDVLEAVKAIQQNAIQHGEEIGWRKGMKEAAEVSKWEATRGMAACNCANQISNAILSTLNKKAR